MISQVFKIVVCVHPVLAGVDASLELDSRNQVKEEPWPRAINERDLLALEQALRIRESLTKRSRVYAVHYGAESADEHLRFCLAMGADEALRIPNKFGKPADGVMIAGFLAQAIKAISPDLILCGQYSSEGMSGVVGPGLAHFLELPSVCGTVGLQLNEVQRRILATQRFDKGARLLWDCPLPAVCAVDLGINEPRYVPVRRLTASREKEVKVLDLGGQEGMGEGIGWRFGNVPEQSLSYPRVRPKKVASVSVTASPADRLRAMKSVKTAKADKSERLRGDPAQIARRIVEVLEEKGFVAK